MKEDENYAKNVELFARDNPLEAYRLEETDCSRLKFCHTLENELNLVDESQEKPLYFHDQGGAVWAAQQWASKLPLEGCNVLFVYGLGLGYYYLPLKPWLADPLHSLVFLEDNPCVVHYFLQTELAAEILNNSQVTIKLLPRVEPNEDGWEQLRQSAASLFWAFALSVPHISALQSYFYSRFDYFHAFSVQWLTGLSNAGRRLGEFYPHSPLVFHNFYANMPYLGETIPGYRLANAMQGIPAVLCGAGPSLAKQLPLLKTLSEQAFLMASGSAMNAVTQASIIPHVGGAIDHTQTQASRQLTSFAYDVPAFYQNRFYGPALAQWHGPLLYMPGSGNYRVSEWFEKELGIQDAEQLIMGVSTSNFLLEIAHFLGCNPIILIGMDLAYTNERRYSEGVSEQPSEIFKNAGRILVTSTNGGEVETTNQWFYEAVCIAAFKQRNPEVICINATEGGMAIPSIPNAVFSQAVNEYLVDSWDIEGWFHGAIQNAAVHKIPLDKVFRAMQKWRASLEACIHHLVLLMEDCEPEKRALWEHELLQEPAYAFLLDTLNTVFDTLNSLRKRKLKWMTNQQEQWKEQHAIEIDRYRFLHLYAADHLKSVTEGIKSFEERTAVLSEKVEQNERLKGPVLPPEYHVDDKQLIPKASWPKSGELIEALIGKVKDVREGQTLYFYPDGTIKAEAFYLAGKLHGPWSFFSPQGILLYRSWFIEGKRQGKVYAFYSDGTLYSITGYCDGMPEGQHLYYYPDGTLKTMVSYKKGEFDGMVRLYYSNGRLKKEQHFVHGQLHGVERMWDEWGNLVLHKC
jgi:antitoxin component YwqK of YwqJK toxin-antitoxin module